jgi:outer membrane protein OmpA-like peptidoglycan-associated protein
MKKNSIQKRNLSIWKTIALSGLIIFSGSCKNLNKTKKGAIIGTAGGAAMGTVIGKASGNAVLGAIIGATVGGAAGVIVGSKMDKQAEEIKKNVPGVEVERVGEGIVIAFDEKILFDFNKSNLKANSVRSLSKFITVLKDYPDTDIEIQGHTDNVGSSAYNQVLSEKRANTVKTYLTNYNIDSKRITVKGLGEEYPKVENDTKKHQEQNRRVEFLISANENMKASAKKEVKSSK